MYLVFCFPFINQCRIDVYLKRTIAVWAFRGLTTGFITYRSPIVGSRIAHSKYAFCSTMLGGGTVWTDRDEGRRLGGVKVVRI